ncbi:MULTISPECIES: class I SAM-dependent methyltransferase [unclassified Mesorhizobium]|uniref:class I SAM-dependent methyltransferase n=1 Tax=unclassified Mesorhizobium TaxID=325217 RepID=UPI00112EF96E|nr:MULTISPECIES: class I SAM-dependent methyltransferase [unclassified Mesorhizobium]TPN50156.1 methyltransferase domain-containing protein [Mesorhizobium sp. B1-1-9]TPN53294.1 methyltransferase domain-containing protein [Mesorhizobium sp. B1-1-7]
MGIQTALGGELRSAVPSPARLRGDCPVCAGQHLLHSVSFKALPVSCNSLHSDAKSAVAAAIGHFALAFCRGCEHFFNAAFEDDRVGYTPDYENSLHFSPRFVKFVEDLAHRLSSTYALEGKLVVDIGCGKGDFLKRICSISGARGIGFDRSYEDNRGEKVAGVEFINDWFGDAYPNVDPDFVSCRHVLEHMANPIAFLQGLRSHPGVGSKSVFYIEVPNALYTLRDMGIWDLIYEHVSYFTPQSLRAAMQTAGFEVLDEGSSYGDQYLFIEAKPLASPTVISLSTSGTIDALVRKFDRTYRDKVAWWHQYLSKQDPAQTVVWGAGSKGITFVNVVPEGARISALVDVNPHKQGRFAPGSGTPVIGPDHLRGRPLHSIIVMNPLYRDEVAQAARQLGLASEIIVA